MLSADTSWLAVTTIDFDIATLELLGPLVSGGEVILATEQDVAQPAALAALIEQHAVSVMQATPATWQMLRDSGWRGNEQLTVLCGGEALPVPLLKALQRKNHQVWNCYGPTEATVWSMMQPVEAFDRMLSVPLGGFLPGYQHYVLDDRGQLAPAGAVGELYIGGPALASGYNGLPELTAERFVPHPFNGAETLYRTGDLVRWLPSGELEYLGRTDAQVKVRGYRIETGEVEAVLEALDDINRAAVVVRGNGASAFLAAFVSALPDMNTDADWRADVQERITRRLPGYMVPSVIVAMQELPLTENGKLDRNALPDIDSREMQPEYVAPETPQERVLCEVFAQLLGLEQVGIKDDFFALVG